MASKVYLPTFGVEIVEGPPGSGKSFVCAKWVLDWVIKERRPVFTNLPFRWRVLREWLRRRYGVEVANLIHELTPEHLLAFMRRAKERKDFRDALQKQARQRGEDIPGDTLNRLWYEHAGPDRLRTTGDDPDQQANWIGEGSVVLVDEIQNIYPMQKQADEGPELREYLSMHRHFMHRFIACSQDRMLISNTIRKVAEKYWKVHNRAKDRLVWGIRFEHLGFTAFGYTAHTKASESFPAWDERSRPYAEFTVIASLPQHRWIFRIYTSYTAEKSPRRLLKKIEDVRQQAGLTRSGHTPTEVEAIMKKRRPLTRRAKAFRAVRRGVRRLAVTAFVVGMGVLIGLAINPPAPPAETETNEVLQHQPPPGTLRVVSPTFARIVDPESRSLRLAPGDRYGPYQLRLLHPPDRLALFVDTRTGVLYAWRAREDPERLGTVDDLRSIGERFGILGASVR